MTKIILSTYDQDDIHPILNIKVGQWSVDQDQDYSRNNKALAVEYAMTNLPSFEKRRNRIPLVWKTLNNEDRQEKNKVDLQALAMFFQRVAPNMIQKIKHLKMSTMV